MKRLKIVEQTIIVMVFAVLIPFITIGFIISNISQQSVRSELTTNAILMSQMVGDAYQNYIKYSQAQLNQMASGFNYIENTMAKVQYFDEIEAKTKLFKNIDIVEKDRLPKGPYEINGNKLTLYSPIDKQNQYYLIAQIDIDIINQLIEKENQQNRKIYIFDYDSHELITSNAINQNTNNVLDDLVIKENINSGIFGENKNTPKVYYKIDSPNWLIIVDTTKHVTDKTINKARFRIILSLCLAALFIFVMVGLYTSYLYINIRQLFKGITAISKGNYDKKIHLLKSVFTPFEIVFLTKEFNYMANKISSSYEDLRNKNHELEKLNKFREDLINSTSHEFRTPLTSIIGYSSRLLRNDIKLDETTKTNSLKVIIQQAQRLSSMVEDLLVIPQLDSLSLKFNIEEIDLGNSINKTLEYLKSDVVEFKTDIDDGLNWIYADSSRLEQILVNLIDNAIKYSHNNAPIEIEAKNIGQMPVLKIKNKCEKISDEIKDKLFEKFIRADSTLTRTTRGTGLGLYIVKGLCDAMNINIKLDCEDDFIITLEFQDYVK